MQNGNVWTRPDADGELGYDHFHIDVTWPRHDWDKWITLLRWVETYATEHASKYRYRFLHPDNDYVRYLYAKINLNELIPPPVVVILKRGSSWKNLRWTFTCKVLLKHLCGYKRRRIELIESHRGWKMKFWKMSKTLKNVIFGSQNDHFWSFFKVLSLLQNFIFQLAAP